MKNRYIKLIQNLNLFRDIPLLVIRLLLAYGFYSPAKMKWKDINGIGEWFSSLGIPFPQANAYLAASTEAAGVVLLTLGLATRIISIPLIITMLVAIYTVHKGNGFDAGNNGFEIPLYYSAMLLILLIYGPGRASIDYLLDLKYRNGLKKTS